MTVRKGIPRQGKHRNEPLRDKMSRSPGSVPTLEHAAGMGQEAFSGRTAKEKWREHMRENLYKRLPPIEHRQDGSLYCMTPAQRKQANSLILGSIAVMRTGTVCSLTMETPALALRPFLSRSAVSGSAGQSCRKSGRWKRRFSGIRS